MNICIKINNTNFDVCVRNLGLLIDRNLKYCEKNSKCILKAYGVLRQHYPNRFHIKKYSAKLLLVLTQCLRTSSRRLMPLNLYNRILISKASSYIYYKMKFREAINLQFSGTTHYSQAQYNSQLLKSFS